MQISQIELIDIINRSCTISERISQNFELDTSKKTDENEKIIDFQLEQWCQLIAQGDWEVFKKRLGWDNLDLKTVRAILGFQKLTDKQLLPAWNITFYNVIQATDIVYKKITENNITEEFKFLDSQYPLPFEEILLPFIYVARQKLKRQTGQNYQLFSEEAHTRLENDLLFRLTAICSPALKLRFSVFCAKRKLDLVSLSKKSIDDSEKHHFIEFTKEMLEKDLLSFFQNYPVLARLTATVTDLWVNTTKEFICRLASDRKEIQSNFFGNTEIGLVVTLQTNLSDHHGGGYTVIALKFASGLKLLYKPKPSIGMEEAFSQLLSWFNKHESSFSFKTIKVINRLTYGWVEFIEYLPCQDQEEAKRYYQRSGMLLCLVHILAGTDFHYENIIASGEHPVLVDVETLMHPKLRINQIQNNSEDATYLASQKLLLSVFRTALLPATRLGQSGQGYDFAGLGSGDEQESLLPIPQWKNINTNKMALDYRHVKTQSSGNVVILDGHSLNPDDYVTEIVDGFQQMYQFILTHRTILLAKNSPLNNFANQSVRFVFLATSAYGSVLLKATHPKFLRDGIEWSIQLEILKKREIWQEIKPLCWPLLEEEQRAMEQLDIPLFTIRSDSDNLTISSGKVVEKFFSEPSYTLVISRLNQLNQTDLEHQINLIKGSFYSRNYGKVDRQNLLEDNDLNLSLFMPLRQDEMVHQANKIGKEIQRWAICSANGDSAAWIAPQPIENSQRWYQLQILGFNLYDGSSGVALFLAALAKVTGNAEFRHLALAALQPLRQALQDSALDKIVNTSSTEKTITGSNLPIGIGGLSGLASHIYVLTRISQFLEFPILLEDANRIASLFTSECIATDKQFDITNGSAGAILGLLLLYKASNSPEVLEQALVCGDHLLNHRVISNSGYRAWATSDGKNILTGFSHGASGIAYSLLRLYKATGETSFLEAAEEGIAYERSVFIPEMGNWPDLRAIFTKDRIGCMCSWCHGAPGIGLARVAGLGLLDNDDIRKDIEVAIKTTTSYSLSEFDDICCGNMGRVEFLFIAAQKLSQPQLSKIAMEKAAKVVARAEQRGTFTFSSNWQNSPFLPGLFQGVSGIGYELLRLSHPDLIPSVLLMD